MATRSVTISVTQEHISKGKRDHCLLCPVALAVQEKFSDKVEVHTRYIQFGIHKYLIPERVRAFVADFDVYGKMEPFEFVIHLQDGDK